MTQKESEKRLTRVLSHLDRDGRHKTRFFLSASELKVESKQLFTAEAVAFVAELCDHFSQEVQQVLTDRVKRNLVFKQAKVGDHLLPDFLPETRHIRENPNWGVSDIPEPLKDRRVDVGDVSPADINHLIAALNSGAQGVQVDLDDGHCPSWTNTIQGLININDITFKKYDQVKNNGAVMIVRPRAWNMTEQNMLVNGRAVPGPLFDFGFHLFHNGRELQKNGTGPFLYLSKVESYTEAALWNRIFEFTERKLRMNYGAIKSIVLIENISAVFEMEEILYELRDHCIGLNCGMWDYSASVISKFHNLPEFVLPDRQKYVSMNSTFLRSYMILLIATCHRRRAIATTGMVPFVLSKALSNTQRDEFLKKTISAKQSEADVGSDGALVYDLGLVPVVKKVFCTTIKSRGLASSANQINYVPPSAVSISRSNLLCFPEGFVTKSGLEFNILIGIKFIEAWLNNKGTVIINGCVEDSATAEISRSQVWQWIRHGICFEETNEIVTSRLVAGIIERIVQDKVNESTKYFKLSAKIFFRLVTLYDFPPFLTTYLYEHICNN